MTMNQQAGPMTGIPSTGGSPAAPEPGKSRRGSALYAPQALWTAAHEHLPVTFVIVNNRSYDILKNFMKSQHHFASVRAGRFIGMDLDEPPIDFLALAASWGLPARRVERAGEIAAAVEHGIASGLPNLIELPVGTA
ncbi:thiamine pyrophosphate-dependent enzyme [Burkholderia gladioli]|uniref:thiamine pyrophosphate-dependent enzyme n=1 Tax=Burkholderia gladioli TaxID=28095 RepID=UPI00163FE1A0|nr:thiamine pyrophosphate-dependent enzyme [Burkholderia gladioli]